MIFNRVLHTGSTGEGLPEEGAAVITASNEAKLDVVVREDVPDYGFYGQNTSHGSILANVKFADEVKTIGDYGFHNQSKMIIESFNNVETIGKSAFISCSLLTINPDNKIKTINSAAFNNCTSLIELELPEIEAIHGIAHTSAVFTGCTNLVKVVLGDNIKILGNSATNNQRVFNNVPALTTINLPASLSFVPTSTFYDCPALTDITVGKDFNATLSLNACGDLSQETLEAMIDNYADASGKKLIVNVNTYALATSALFTGSELTIAEYASAKGLTIATS